MHRTIRRILGFFATAGALVLSSCDNTDGVIFSTQDDLKLGQQLAEEVDSTYRAQGLLLERDSSKPEIQQAYQSLDRITNRILTSGKVKHQQDFPWTVKIIRDEETLNAFATPGGHLYVFTGLIKSLEEEDHLAGVLAHEIAHADKRHSVKQLQRDFGISLLLAAAMGKAPSTLREIAVHFTGTAAQLKFSRDAETEADLASVDYLAGTAYYACDGAAGFFLKLDQEMQQQNKVSEFLSTHPNPGNRLENIRQRATEIGCNTASGPDSDFEKLKSALKL